MASMFNKNVSVQEFKQSNLLQCTWDHQDDIFQFFKFGLNLSFDLEILVLIFLDRFQFSSLYQLYTFSFIKMCNYENFYSDTANFAPQIKIFLFDEEDIQARFSANRSRGSKILISILSKWLRLYFSVIFDHND